MSAVSHALTIHAPLRFEHVGQRSFKVEGTPADCVNLAVRQAAADASRRRRLRHQPRRECRRRHRLLGHRRRRARSGDARRARDGGLAREQGRRRRLLPRRGFRRPSRSGPGAKERLEPEDVPERQRARLRGQGRPHHESGTPRRPGPRSRKRSTPLRASTTGSSRASRESRGKRSPTSPPCGTATFPSRPSSSTSPPTASSRSFSPGTCVQRHPLSGSLSLIDSDVD